MRSKWSARMWLVYVKDMVTWLCLDLRVWLCGLAGHRFAAWHDVQVAETVNRKRECTRCGLVEFECPETGWKDSLVVW